MITYSWAISGTSTDGNWHNTGTAKCHTIETALTIALADNAKLLTLNKTVFAFTVTRIIIDEVRNLKC